MEIKECKNCKLKIPTTGFNSKGQGRLSSICKVCEYTAKKKFTVDIPPNTKICKHCGHIKDKMDYKKDSANCNECRDILNPKPKYIRPDEKQCRMCLDVFPISNFYTKGLVKGIPALQHTCKQCSNKRRAKSRKERPTDRYLQLLEFNKVRKKGNYEESKEKIRAKKYGIDLETLNKMIETQNNKCYICSKPAEENTNGKLVIDHCHSSNKVRKLLCNYCNTTLGAVKDDLEYIQKLVDYIKEHQ